MEICLGQLKLLQDTIILAINHINNKQYEEAEKYLITVLNVAEGLDSNEAKVKLAKGKYELARLYTKIYRIEDAIVSLYHTIKLYQELKLEKLEADALDFLGSLFINSKNQEKARKILEKAHKIYMNLGRQYLSYEDYFHAEQAFLQAMNALHKIPPPHQHETKILIKSTLKEQITTKLGYFKDLTVIANYNCYSSNFEKGRNYAWRALTISLDILVLLVNFISSADEEASLNLNKNFSESCIKAIRNRFQVCQNAIIQNVGEIEPVIKLKLSEFKLFLKKQHLKTLQLTDNALNQIKIQKESIRYLFPIHYPQFLVLTIDGRLIHYFNKGQLDNTESGDNSTQYRIAGILVAIKSILYETMYSDSGIVQEIYTANGTMLIETRENIIVVAIYEIVLGNIDALLSDLATKLQKKYSKLLNNWLGNKTEIKPIQNDIDKFLNSHEY